MIPMAGEVGHVVYGERVLQYFDNTVGNPSFWVGTLFPDIRHMGVVSRHRTHPEHVSLSSLPGLNDFQTGLRVHAWVDATRQRFLRDKHIKETLPWHPFVPHALKLVEDELLYDRFDDWNLIHRVLGNVYDDEMKLIEDRRAVTSWPVILQTYFRKRPDDETRKKLSMAIGLSDQSADEMNNVVAMLKENKRSQALVSEFLSYLERLLT
jgi:hypothetical protein